MVLVFIGLYIDCSLLSSIRAPHAGFTEGDQSTRNRNQSVSKCAEREMRCPLHHLMLIVLMLMQIFLRIFDSFRWFLA